MHREERLEEQESQQQFFPSSRIPDSSTGRTGGVCRFSCFSGWARMPWTEIPLFVPRSPKAPLIAPSPPLPPSTLPHCDK